jgi:hypothetical protein
VQPPGSPPVSTNPPAGGGPATIEVPSYPSPPPPPPQTTAGCTTMFTICSNWCKQGCVSLPGKLLCNSACMVAWVGCIASSGSR